MADLKPCPFCGGEAIMLKDHKAVGIYIACKTCSCCTTTVRTKEDAIIVWNTRPAPPRRPLAWRRLSAMPSLLGFGKAQKMPVTARAAGLMQGMSMPAASPPCRAR